MKLGLPGLLPQLLAENAPVTPGAAVAWRLCAAVTAIFWILGIVFVLVLVRRLVRAGWLAGLVVSLLFTGPFLEASGRQWVTVPLAFLSVAIIVFTTVRFGVFAAVVAETCSRFVRYGMTSNDPSNWTFYGGMICVAGVVMVAWWGAKTALAGKPLFGGEAGLEA